MTGNLPQAPPLSTFSFLGGSWAWLRPRSGSPFLLSTGLLPAFRWKCRLPWSRNHPVTIQHHRAGQDLRAEPRQLSQPTFLHQWNKLHQVREWTDPSSHCESVSQAAFSINSPSDFFLYLYLRSTEKNKQICSSFTQIRHSHTQCRDLQILTLNLYWPD